MIDQTGRSKAAESRRGFLAFNSPLHDYSVAHTTHNRIAKLGITKQAASALAIASFDDITKQLKLGHGSSAPDSFGYMEPDNWTPCDRGGGDFTWETRHVVDHENHSASIAHRSTIGL